MTEYNDTFELVLYFNRVIAKKPVKPTYQSVKEANPDSSMDGVLDIYSDLSKKYDSDIEKYRKELANGSISDKTTESHVFIYEDENFLKNVKEFENNDFFISWTPATKTLIKDTLK